MVESQGKIDCVTGFSLKKLLLIAVVLFPLISCGSAQEEAGWINSSDGQLRRMAEAILVDVIESSGLEILEQIQVDYRTPEEMSDYVRFKLEQDLPKSKESHVAESYRLLGLFPEDLNLRQTLSSLYEEQVIGFYNPDDKTLYLQEEVPIGNLESLLAHEMVHALQDQHFDLNALTDGALNNDQSAAVMAAIEGHATLAMLDLMSKNNRSAGLDIEDVLEFGKSIVNGFESAEIEGGLLGTVPLVIRETMIFPYIEGARFVQVMRDKDGIKSVPFEAKLPKSTQQVMHFDGSDIEEMIVPRSIEITPSDNWIKLYENTLGELEVSLFLEELTGRKSSAEGWRGDRFVLLEGIEDNRTLVWVSFWDTVEDRNEFYETVESHIELLGEEVRISSMSIDGFAGLSINIGPEADVEVILETN